MAAEQRIIVERVGTLGRIVLNRPEVGLKFFMSEDFREGTASFFDERQPKWRGRK